jgi:hypothetical protein
LRSAKLWLIVVAWIAGCGASDACALGPINAFGFSWGRTLTDRSIDAPEDASPNSPTSFRWGWTIGTFVDWGLPWNGFGLTTEFSHVEKGFARDVTREDPLDPGTVEIRDKYLSVALLLTREFGTGESRPFAFAGPSVEMLRGKVRDRERFGKRSLAVQFGGGARFSSVLQIRACFFLDLNGTAGSGFEIPGEVKNYGFTFTGGLRFSV